VEPGGSGQGGLGSSASTLIETLESVFVCLFIPCGFIWVCIWLLLFEGVVKKRNEIKKNARKTQDSSILYM